LSWKGHRVKNITRRTRGANILRLASETIVRRLIFEALELAEATFRNEACDTMSACVFIGTLSAGNLLLQGCALKLTHRVAMAISISISMAISISISVAISISISMAIAMISGELTSNSAISISISISVAISMAISSCSLDGISVAACGAMICVSARCAMLLGIEAYEGTDVT